MKVLLDFHHHALAESYALTLADRFGWDLWFPWGMGWFDQGIWQFEKEWHGDRVARQYLEGIWAEAETGCCTAHLKDPRHPNRYLKGVTLEAARAMGDWDLVVSSLPANDEGYAHFADTHGATFGVQVGNDLQYSRWDLAQFIWSSSTLPGFGPEHIGKRFTFNGTPTVMTHQEFSLDIFHDRPPMVGNVVASFVNCFCEGPSYPHFKAFAKRHSDEFDFRVYGAYGSCEEDEFAAGDLSWVPDIADAMANARIGWHTKHWSDGFGHTIHNWFALGRPIVGFQRYYQDKLAGVLWDEGKTAFDIERLSEAELVDLLRRLRDDDDWYQRLCEQAAWRFHEYVDFDAEAALVKSLIEDVA